MRPVRYLTVFILAAAPFVGRATDQPHEDGASCSNCHLGHNAEGAGLTKAAGNFTLCNSCHVEGTSLVTGITGQAVPGVSGISHRWDADASNMGATPPSPSSEMGMRLDGGKLMCSTCHDQHQADVLGAAGRGSQHLSAATKSFTAGGNGTVQTMSAPAGIAAVRYTLQFTTGGGVGAAKFQVSKDNGLSWVQTGVTTAATVTIVDGVVLAFGGTNFVASEKYTFYVSYPFLRVDNTDARMCLVCHVDRNMSVANVEGDLGSVHQGTSQPIVPGTTVFHHPVGNDVKPTAMLDANGQAQGGGSTDPNSSNDLVLGASGGVTCLTCHRVHKADSNSLTTDQ